VKVWQADGIEVLLRAKIDLLLSKPADKQTNDQATLQNHKQTYKPTHEHHK
jgi:hypothetical protein